VEGHKNNHFSSNRTIVERHYHKKLKAKPTKKHWKKLKTQTTHEECYFIDPM
jgi:hypothetical protein